MTGVDARGGRAVKEGWTAKARRQGSNYGPYTAGGHRAPFLYQINSWVRKAPTLLSMKPNTKKKAKGWADTSSRQQAAVCSVKDIAAHAWVLR